MSNKLVVLENDRNWSSMHLVNNEQIKKLIRRKGSGSSVKTEGEEEKGRKTQRASKYSFSLIVPHRLDNKASIASEPCAPKCKDFYFFPPPFGAFSQLTVHTFSSLSKRSY